MTGHHTEIEERARTWLTEAVRSRDTVTVSALRALLGSLGGLGAEPSAAEVEGVLQREIDERRTAYEMLGGRGDKAKRLHAEADVLEALMHRTAP